MLGRLSAENQAHFEKNITAVLFIRVISLEALPAHKKDTYLLLLN